METRMNEENALKELNRMKSYPNLTAAEVNAIYTGISCIKRCIELNKFAKGYYGDRTSEYDTKVNKDLGILGGV